MNLAGNCHAPARGAAALAVCCAAVFAVDLCAASESGRATTEPAARGSLTPSPPRGIAAAMETPRLVGQGLLRWLGLRVYDASLWAAGQRFDAGRPMESVFALELRYRRSLEGTAIAEASIREIARLGFGTPAQQEAWLQAMRRLFPDVRDGDRLAGVHRPAQGVEFLGNDAPLGRIEDPEFARAFFAIWLDHRTSAPDLRRALLAGAPTAGRPSEPSR